MANVMHDQAIGDKGTGFIGRKLLVAAPGHGLRHVAARIAAAGGEVVFVGRDARKLAAARGSLTAYDATVVHTMTADLSDATAVKSLRQPIDAEHADAALPVNAAGVFAPKPFLEHTAEDYDRYLALNRRKSRKSPRSCCPTTPDGVLERCGTPTAASWPGATDHGSP